MLKISNQVSIAEDEIEWSAIRSPGSGGQNVNKVATAIHLRFDIRASSLPEYYKERLLQLSDQRISKEGIIVIKASSFRRQEKNLDDALQRLVEMVSSVAVVQKQRKATKPSRGAQQRRLESKAKHGRIKALRGRVPEG